MTVTAATLYRIRLIGPASLAALTLGNEGEGFQFFSEIPSEASDRFSRNAVSKELRLIRSRSECVSHDVSQTHRPLWSDGLCFGLSELGYCQPKQVLIADSVFTRSA